MSRSSSASAALLLVAALLSACHRRPPVAEAPTPPPSNNEQARRDSIARAEQARRDSLARAQAYADSVRNARERADEARRTLEERIYFDFDKSDLRPDARNALDAKVPILRANPALRIRIEGNCDERGSASYNMALGQRRAAEAKRYLADNGIDPSRVEIVSYGSERPVAEGHDESAWAQNRRDDFVIIAGG